MDKFDSIMPNENDLPNGSFGSVAAGGLQGYWAAAMHSEAAAHAGIFDFHH